MPVKATPKFTAWSYSRLTDWEKCPLRAKLKHIDKLKEPGSAAMDRGTEIHALAEKFSTLKIDILPKELKLFGEEFQMLRARSKMLEVETQMALTDKWISTDWFGPAAWVRVIMDCFFVDGKTAKVIDYKTGKINPDHKDQLSLYSIAAFSENPNVTTVESELWYLDQGEIVAKKFDRKGDAKERKYWEKRTLPMLKDETFKPKPGDHCRWCAFSASKGGQCQY